VVVCFFDQNLSIILVSSKVKKIDGQNFFFLSVKEILKGFDTQRTKEPEQPQTSITMPAPKLTIKKMRQIRRMAKLTREQKKIYRNLKFCKICYYVYPDNSKFIRHQKTHRENQKLSTLEISENINNK
jgi:hypothetical protein